MSAIVEDGGIQLAKVSFLPNNAATNATEWLKALNWKQELDTNSWNKLFQMTKKCPLYHDVLCLLKSLVELTKSWTDPMLVY